MNFYFNSGNAAQFKLTFVTFAQQNKNMDSSTKAIISSAMESSLNMERMGNLLESVFAVIEPSDYSSSEDSDAEQVQPICNFVVTVDSWNDEEFKSHMRLMRTTVDYLIGRFEQRPTLSDKNHGGKPQLSDKKMIYIFLWYISNTITYRQLAKIFGVAKSTTWYVVDKVATWLMSIGKEFVQWPTGTYLSGTCKFKDRKKIPNVIGAIDGTHIYINAPKMHKECYFNRKQCYRVTLQAVVDADKKFTNLNCGEPGSMHDSRILRRSHLYISSENNLNMFPNSTFLLGDSAYGNSDWIVTPFKDTGHLTCEQKRFNNLHSSARIVVENAFGLLKTRFRRIFKFTEHRDLKSISNLVISACILHNICIEMEGDTSVENDVEENEDQEDDHELTGQPSQNRRNMLFNYLISEHII